VTQQRASQQKDSFLDFTLKRTNPCDTDYGRYLDEGRRLVVQESIESAYFWSNIASLGLLGCLFIIILYQHRIQRRREWSAAEMLAQYQHSLSLANEQVEQATKRNVSLMEALTRLREPSLRAAPGFPKEASSRARVPAPRSQAASTPPVPEPPAQDNTVKPAVASTAVAATTTQSGNQIGLFQPDVDLLMKVNTLEQQLGRSRDEAKLLRRQVNQAGQRVQAEEQKNRVLKGE
jgi:hypothetical protein